MRDRVRVAIARDRVRAVRVRGIPRERRALAEPPPRGVAPAPAAMPR